MIQPIPPRYTRNGQPLPMPLPMPLPCPLPLTDDEALALELACPACGWFDSSWALRQGLLVSVLPDSDGAVAALWFAELAPRFRGSAQQA